jgi:FkbM family methyltransferase
MSLITRVSSTLSGIFKSGPQSSSGYPNPEYDPRVHQERVQRWQDADSDARLRTDYACLAPESIVLDLGGFHGDFALLMNAKYGALCHVFEVVPDLCDAIRTRSAGNSRIVVHPFGLAGADREEELFLADEGSSTFADRSSAGRRITIRLVDAARWFEKELAGRTVDLMKVNIEGGEYELLEHLIAMGLVPRIRNIQVQFHEDVIPRAARRMERIQSRLAKTHHLTWQERFVWENWELSPRR